MPTSFQQKARLRKGIYAGLILALFTGSYFLRDRVIFAQAERLGLREETKGEVELTGSAVRLSLTGSRGLAVCMLWLAVQDKQRRHEWNEMELLVSSVAKLQPHFISPWLYQSWNMAFNVPAECDSPYDKYFYICRGIQLLAEGEKRNQGSKNGIVEFPGNPDLRFHMGFYYQLRIGKSDENKVYTTLFQMSSIRPSERDTDSQDAGLQPKDEHKVPKIHPERFRQFCEKNPRLVRRMRETLGLARPEDIVNFLRQHKNVPSRFAGNKLKDNALDRFPVLPPKGGDPSYHDDDKGSGSVKGSGSTLGDDFDTFKASRSWYLYAQKPLPPLDPELGTGRFDWDVTKYRLPRMAHHIFRQWPSLALVNVAERLSEEGWFDHTGWIIKVRSGKPWFTRDVGGGNLIEEPVLVGNSEKYSSQKAWDDALQAFLDFGTRTRFRLPDAWSEWNARLARNVAGMLSAATGSPAAAAAAVKNRADAPDEMAVRYAKIQKQSNLTWVSRGRADGTPPATEEQARAQRKLDILIRSRSLTGYNHHYYRADAERTSQAIAGRKNYFHAKVYEEYEGNRKKSVEELEQWLSAWTDLMQRKPGFRDCDDQQEEAYHRQLVYFDRFQQLRKSQLQTLLLFTAASAPTSRVPLPIYHWINAPFRDDSDPQDPDKPKWEEWQREQIARIIPLRTYSVATGQFSPRGPFDEMYDDRAPFVPLHMMNSLREKWMKFVTQAKTSASSAEPSEETPKR